MCAAKNSGRKVNKNKANNKSRYMVETSTLSCYEGMQGENGTRLEIAVLLLNNNVIDVVDHIYS